MSPAPMLEAVATAAPAAPLVADGNNKVFRYDVTTAASPAAVWAVWMDVAGWGRWDLGLESARSEGALAAGVKGQIVPRSGPASRFRVTAFVPLQSYAFETALPLAKLTVRRAIVGTAPTVIRHEVRFSGLLAGVWAGRFGPSFRAALPPTMHKLVTIAEAGGR
jgi:hypothetical protein